MGGYMNAVEIDLNLIFTNTLATIELPDFSCGIADHEGITPKKVLLQNPENQHLRK